MEEITLIIEVTSPPLFDVMGGRVRFLASPADTSSEQSFLRGTLPPGVVVPLHKHDDPETFYLLEGEMQLYYDDGNESGWKAVRAGDLAVIPGGVKHAWWNRGDTSCEALIVTGADVYALFQEIAIPAPESSSPGAPDPERIAAVAAATRQHKRIWVASPEENAKIGLPM